MSAEATRDLDLRARWPRRRIAVYTYPFAAGAVAINFFFVGLMIQAIGFGPLTPLQSIGIGLIGGVPATWWFAGRIRRLMDEADGIEAP